MNELDKMFKECRPFLEKNLEQIAFGGLALYRGVTRGSFDGLVRKKSPRRRKEVNSWLSHFFYNRISKFGNRMDSVFSTQCGGQTENPWLQMRFDNTYIVFPVGSNYKLGWSPGTKDFSNLGPTTSEKIPYRWLSDLKYLEYAESPKFDKMSGNEFNRWMSGSYIGDSASQNRLAPGVTKDPDKFENAYERLQRFFRIHYKWFEEGEMEEVDKYYSAIEGTRKKVDQYVKNEQISQKIKASARGLEISVKAPEGVYYAKPKVLDKLTEKAKNKS